MNRRQFMQTTAGAAALLALRQRAFGYAVSPRIQKFITPIRTFGSEVGQIPVARADTTTYPGIDYYDMEVGVYRDQLHPDLPNPTRLYGYRNRVGGTYKHLGGAIVATKDRPVRLKMTCSLPTSNILPFDATIAQGTVGGYTLSDRTATHLHGGLVPWPSDGGPFHWISSGGIKGASLPGAGWLPDATGALTNDNFYPNHQSARFMWYHDHAIGITRTNAYAGVASGYFIIDGIELGLGIPVPGDILVFQDKVFWDPAVDLSYGNYVNASDLGGAKAGDLWYPYIYDPTIWELAAGRNPPIPSCVAEMFGDTMLVNGTPYPYMNVAGRHRLRLLNACNARFLNLSFAVEDPNAPGEPAMRSSNLPLLAPVSVWMIGTEGGFLPVPVQLVNNGVAVRGARLLMGPAERVDLIVDFTNAAGMRVILYSDAPAPFPGGNPLFDYSTQTGNATPTLGPNTRTLMQFRVDTGGASFALPTLAGANPVLPTTADKTNGGLKLQAAPGSVVNHLGIDYSFVTATQELTLNEAFDGYGRLAQIVGNVNNPTGVFGSQYWDGPGEEVGYKTIQIWNVYNLTADTHPMHTHLFNALILRRRPFRVRGFAGQPVWTGPGRGPDPGEEGWKETFKMHPGECITLAVLVEDPFHLPGTATVHGSDSTARTYYFQSRGPGNSPPRDRTANPGYSPRLLSGFGMTADEYVWHCHILEHEEHDMMHSLAAK